MTDENKVFEALSQAAQRVIVQMEKIKEVRRFNPDQPETNAVLIKAILEQGKTVVNLGTGLMESAFLLQKDLERFEKRQEGKS